VDVDDAYRQTVTCKQNLMTTKFDLPKSETQLNSLFFGEYNFFINITTGGPGFHSKFKFSVKPLETNSQEKFIELKFENTYDKVNPSRLYSLVKDPFDKGIVKFINKLIEDNSTLTSSIQIHIKDYEENLIDSKPIANELSINMALAHIYNDAPYHTEMNFIIITGPPYSGKGTQCDELVKEYGLIHLSTGEHIRKEKEGKTELGKTMSDYDERGELVPDEIMKELLDKLIEENKEASGIILDGYPRTIAQVHDLVNVLDSRNIPIESIINIEVPTDELLKRAKKRSETSTREDDKNPETHYKRIRVFEEQTKPTIEYMKKEFDVNTFDGLGTIEEITERIKASM